MKGAVAQLATCESDSGKTHADLKRAQGFGGSVAGDGR